MNLLVILVISVAFASAQDSGIGVPSGKFTSLNTKNKKNSGVKSNDKSLCQTCDLPEKWRVGCNQAYQV